jgi:hypothetical protein
LLCHFPDDAEGWFEDGNHLAVTKVGIGKNEPDQFNDLSLISKYLKLAFRPLLGRATKHLDHHPGTDED